MTKQSSDPKDWFFSRYGGEDDEWLFFINPKSENGAWDQHAYGDLQDTVFAPMGAMFDSFDEPMECHVCISRTEGSEDEFASALVALGMEERADLDRL